MILILNICIEPMKPYLKSKAELPQYRSINTISVLANFLSTQGIEIDSILSGCKFTKDDLNDPVMRITPEQELDVFRNVIKLSPEPHIGLVLGDQFHIGVNGHLGVAAMLSDTILDALHLVSQYMELTLTFFQYTLFVKDGVAIAKMKELVELNDLRRFVCEREFVSVQRMTADLLGIPVSCNEVHFAYPKPDYGDYYEECFNCPVVFNAKEHMVLFDEQLLNRPLPKANPMMRKSLEQECIRLSNSLKEYETISNRIGLEIRNEEEGFPSIETLAQRLNMSSRTLRRRLASEGTSYQAILTESLKIKAINLLTTTDLSIEDVAVKLGYSDVPNFYPAFKRWTGRTPNEYRKQKK